MNPTKIVKQKITYSNSKSKMENEVQRKHLDKWIKEHVTFDPLTTTSLQLAYSHYCSFMLQQNVLPFTKKTFSILLRLEFKDKENNYELEFYTRSSVHIRGLRIDEKNVELVQKADSDTVFTSSGKKLVKLGKLVPDSERGVFFEPFDLFEEAESGNMFKRSGKELVSMTEKNIFELFKTQN